MALYTGEENSESIKVYFVQDGATCSKEMRYAFSVCQDAKFHPKIISEDSVNDLKELGSNSVYVLENFTGEIFEFLSDKSCLVVGPPCITSCVSARTRIPDNGSPVYHTALQGVVISTTNLQPKDRDEIRKLSGYMGAVYSEALTLAVTHLIAENVTLSGKCAKAMENNIPIIWPGWVRKTWESIQMQSELPVASNFKLPPFQGMHISCSNLSSSVKKKLQQLIESNGGVYQRTLELKKTAVLVIGNAEGKKWQFAQQWQIPCVAPSWIYESVEKGYLVPSQNHLIIPRPKCSTPTNSAHSESFMSSDLSVVPQSSDRSRVDETNFSSFSDLSVRSVPPDSKMKGVTPAENNYKKIMRELSSCSIRSAGLFLDGCKIFLSGFSPLEVEMLKKIINSGGATLFPSISDCLSHIIVGEFSLSDAQELASLNPRPHVVELSWLLQCIREKCNVPIEPYLCLRQNYAPPSSPLSNKCLKILKPEDGPDSPSTPVNEIITPVARKLFTKAKVLRRGITERDDGNDVGVNSLEMHGIKELNREKEQQSKSDSEIREQNWGLEEVDNNSSKTNNQEGNSKNSDQLKETSMNIGDENTLAPLPFFQGLWFEILVYDDIQQIQNSIELVGGKLISGVSDPIPDYAIVPVEGTTIKTNAKNIVSLIFLEDCYDQSCLVAELEYFHRPLPGLLGVEKKLEGAVIALSGFKRAERRLLEHVATTLGALVQVMFSRSEYPERGVKRSTHLVCKEMLGKKYEAALKWGIPVVGPSWLLEQIDTHTVPSQPLSEPGSTDSKIGDAFSTLKGEDMDAERIALSHHKQTFKRASACDDPEPFNSGVPEPAMRKNFTPEPIKRWKSSQHGVRPETPTAKKTLPPTDVVMKQLWVQCGGVKLDGIEPGTGKILHDGPFAKWADWDRNSISREDTPPEGRLRFAEPPEVSAAQEKDSHSAEITPIRKKWKNFIRNCSDDVESPVELLKSKRPSTPLDVIKKQMWAKFGDASYVGIEPGTGKLLKDGPYGEWAKSSLSTENSFTESANINPPLTHDARSIRANDSQSHNISSRSSETIPSVVCSKHIQLSPRNELSKESGKSPASSLSDTTSIPLQDNQPGLLDFNPVHSSTICEDIKDASERTISRIGTDLKIFLLSGFSVVNKQRYEGIIKQLGGALTQANNYDPNTTHIIIEKPIRTEKLLCCIASGKWVLHSSYLDFCYESRKFLPEQEFEWGNPASSSRLPKLQPGSTEEGLANAAHKWRLRKRDMGSAAPFKEMKVVLYTSKNKEPQFRRLLVAGGATILPHSDVLNATYIVWEEDRIELGVPLKVLASRNIHVVPPVYLGEYLVKAPPPAQYYPADYLKATKLGR